MTASMNVTKEKLQRKKNFSADEVGVLTEGFMKYKIYLQAPFNNKVTNDGKNQRCNEIRDTVNALGHEVRTTDEIKHKWKNQLRCPLQYHSSQYYPSLLTYYNLLCLYFQIICDRNGI